MRRLVTIHKWAEGAAIVTFGEDGLDPELDKVRDAAIGALNGVEINWYTGGVEIVDTKTMDEDDPCPRCGGDHDRIDSREPCEGSA